MTINKTAVATAITAVLGSASHNAYAALAAASVLEFNPGTIICLEGGTPPGNCINNNIDIGGSYFALDSTGDNIISPSEKSPISMFNGIVLGTAQPASGSHSGVPNGSESPDIDNPWSFKLSAGMHQSLTAITIVDNDVNNDGGFTKTLDFSGWGITWNAIPNIPLGGGTQDCGTASDGICLAGNGTTDFAGTYDNGSGLATITCSIASCSTSSTFTLSYAAVIPKANPSGFGGVPYSLFLDGNVSAVPIPAAAWLFGSGLLGLLGVAKRT